jgi:hypothetical protein
MKVTFAALYLLMTCSAFGHVVTSKVELSLLEKTWADADLVVCGRVDKLEAIYYEEVLSGYTVRLSVERVFKGSRQKKIEFKEELFITPPHPMNSYGMFSHYVVFLKKNIKKDEKPSTHYDELLSFGMRLDGTDPDDFMLAPDSIQDQVRRFIISKITKEPKMKGSNKAEVATP